MFQIHNESGCFPRETGSIGVSERGWGADGERVMNIFTYSLLGLKLDYQKIIIVGKNWCNTHPNGEEEG